MTPRKCSLQVAHQAHCPNVNKTSLASIDKACKTSRCKPSYYTFERDHNGKVRKGPRVGNRRDAEKLLRERQVEIDRGRTGYEEERNIDFPEWVTEYKRLVQGRIDQGSNKPGTLRAYTETLDGFAVPAIGYVPVRRLSAEHYQAFFDSLAGLSTASQIRHIKQLRACLGAAVKREYASSAILDKLAAFKSEQRLKLPRRGKAAFEDGELDRLWSAYREKINQDKKPWPAVYLHASRFAVETGLRIGELVALDLDSLRGGDLHVDYTFGLDGLVAPKDGESRTVYLTAYALAVLADWLPIRGTDDGPLFPGPTGGRLGIRETQRKLEKAMEAAGIPKLHPELEKPRSFHSLRYSTSVLMQRRGVHPRLVEQTLGHGSLELTYGVYGGWSPAQLREEAARHNR